MNHADGRSDGPLTWQLRIEGRVQGVGYRHGLRREALRLGLTGWVRNRRDGSVEAVAQGAKAALEALVAWSRHGPPLAHVRAVATTDFPGDPGFRFEGFEQRPTC